jgi:signal transduction histidine kinase
MRKIVRESARTSLLVDDLLLLARADSSADELRLEPIDVSATGREAGELATTLAEAKNIRFSANIPKDPIIVNGSEQLLSRLWLILLDNAVKYTPEEGRITFAMGVSNSHLETTVSDTGIGISAADLPHVYDRFWRADRVRSRNMGGAGLGLSIARWIVLRHGGEIEIGSEPGRGSQVTVRFPMLAGVTDERRVPAAVSLDLR